jgi:hypothetical protein
MVIRVLFALRTSNDMSVALIWTHNEGFVLKTESLILRHHRGRQLFVARISSTRFFRCDQPRG